MITYTYTTFLRYFYSFSFFYEFIFAYTIYNYFFSVHGLSIFSISMLFAWWSLTVLLLEIPSGALADYWSRKNLLVIAPILKSSCFVVWIFSNSSIVMYALGFLLWSIAEVLLSGTKESFVYDTLDHFNKTSDVEKVFGRERFYITFAWAIAMFFGGIFGSYSLELTLLLSILPLLICLIFALLMKEPPRKSSTGEIRYLEYIKVALNEVRVNPPLRFLFIFTLGLTIVNNMEEYDQLYYKLVHIPIYVFGIIFLFGVLLEAFSALYAYKIKGLYWTEYTFLFLIGLCFFLMGALPNQVMILLLPLAYILNAPLRVLNISAIQNTIKSMSRATVTSVSTLFQGAFSIVFVLIFGTISSIWNLEASYIFAGSLLMLFSFWVLTKRKTRRSVKNGGVAPMTLNQTGIKLPR